MDKTMPYNCYKIEFLCEQFFISFTDIKLFSSVKKYASVSVFRVMDIPNVLTTIRCVNDQISGLIVFLSKWFSTSFTTIRFTSCVNYQISGPIVFLSK